MAKKKKESTATPVPVQVEPVAVVEVQETDEMELLQVDVGDMVKLKQILDETVASALLETLQENYSWDNVKLAIMSAACGFAVVAQFSPVPFPESRPLLGICCCVYFLLSGVLQLITTFVDKDCILLTQPLEKSKNKQLQQYGVRVRSNLPRFSEFYTLRLEFQGLPETPYVEQTWSVGKFFDVEGMFDEVGLMQAVQQVLERMEAKKYSGIEGKDKKKTE